MTEMRRMTISLPDELDRRILELRKDDRFSRCSYSEIVRQVLDHGFSMLADKKGREREKQNSFLGKAAGACLMDFSDYIFVRSADDLSLKSSDQSNDCNDERTDCNNIVSDPLSHRKAAATLFLNSGRLPFRLITAAGDALFQFSLSAHFITSAVEKTEEITGGGRLRLFIVETVGGCEPKLCGCEFFLPTVFEERIDLIERHYNFGGDDCILLWGAQNHLLLVLVDVIEGIQLFKFFCG